MGATTSALATVSSAEAPPSPCFSRAWTRCPTAYPRTSAPIPSTTPATSNPGTQGRRIGRISRIAPDASFQSIGLTEAARTRTSSWFGPGTGSGRSAGSRTSGPP
jgi:hypothetical protein